MLRDHLEAPRSTVKEKLSGGHLPVLLVYNYNTVVILIKQVHSYHYAYLSLARDSWAYQHQPMANNSCLIQLDALADKP